MNVSFFCDTNLLQPIFDITKYVAPNFAVEHTRRDLKQATYCEFERISIDVLGPIKELRGETKKKKKKSALSNRPL